MDQLNRKFNKKVVLTLVTLILVAGVVFVWKNKRNADLPALSQKVQENVDKIPENVRNTAPENKFNTVSLPALFEKNLEGSNFELGKKLLETTEYNRYYITYKSGDLRIRE